MKHFIKNNYNLEEKKHLQTKNLTGFKMHWS